MYKSSINNCDIIVLKIVYLQICGDGSKIAHKFQFALVAFGLSAGSGSDCQILINKQKYHASQIPHCNLPYFIPSSESARKPQS